MSRRSPASAVLAALLAGCSGGGGAPADPPSTAIEEAPPAPEPAAIEAGRAPPPGPYAAGVDVLHYRIELTLSEDEDVVAGRTRIRFRRTDRGTDRLPLDLTGLAVDSVRVAASGSRDWRAVPIGAYRPSLARGRLPVPLPAEAGDTMAVEVFYRGTPDDGLILGRTLHGETSAFADNWPNRARFWFPSVDHPSDKAAVSFVVHAPSAWEVVANGALVGPPARSGPDIPGSAGPGAGETERRTWLWQTRVPIPTYTMVVGATTFTRSRVGLAACERAPESPRRDGCIEVSTWLYPGSVEEAAPSFRRAAEMVDFFTRTVGPFPYEKLANVQSSTRFGGMENASAVFYSERALASGRSVEGTVSHEIAHQWFGDAVTEADWHHLWLSEGFATYFGALFFQESDGKEDFRRRMDRSRERYLSSDAPRRPVVDAEVDDLFELLNANNYSKGGWVLHMLRGLLGEEAFFRGVRAYYEAHLHGAALTQDFRRAMEEASGRSLEWFFDQWIFRPGHPVLNVTWRYDEGAGLAHVRIEQAQPRAWPTFRIPTRLHLGLADGSTRDRKVELRDRVEEVEISVPAAPRSVRVDPEGWLLAEVTDQGRVR